MGTTDISSIWERSEKKIPVWIKYGEKGKGKGSKIFISSMGRGGPFWAGGGEFSVFRGKRGWNQWSLTELMGKGGVYQEGGSLE